MNGLSKDQVKAVMALEDAIDTLVRLDCKVELHKTTNHGVIMCVVNIHDNSSVIVDTLEEWELKYD